jgi:hypothetical protein
LNERAPENTGMIKRIVLLMLSIKHGETGEASNIDQMKKILLNSIGNKLSLFSNGSNKNGAEITFYFRCGIT